MVVSEQHVRDLAPDVLHLLVEVGGREPQGAVAQDDELLRAVGRGDLDPVLLADLIGGLFDVGVRRLRLFRVDHMDVVVLLHTAQDSQSDIYPEGFDYWIGSAHYQRQNGKPYAADWGEEAFAACRDGAFGGDALAVTEGYFREVARVAAMKPTILGHMDLITKLNAGNRFFDESAPRYRRAALEALHAADPTATLLEINTGGMARGYRDTPYPALFLLKEWRVMGGKIILTSDSHSTDTILYGYGDSIALAKAAGFTKSTLLTMNGRTACNL